MDYGVREYDARDLEGGVWSFMTSLDGPADTTDQTPEPTGEHHE